MTTATTSTSTTPVIAPSTPVWKLDPTHTLVEFSAKHMMFTTVKGRFEKVDAEINWDENNLANSSVEATIEAASLFTGDEKRDGHLRSADFFHADEYPTLTFKSKRIEPKGASEFRIIGDLTIRGISKEVALDASLLGKGKTPWGGEIAAFESKATINRKDWDLQWNVALETGGWLVGDAIKIEIHTELSKQN